MALRVHAAAREVLEDSSGVDKHTRPRAGGVHGVDERPIEGYAWSAAV